ncbi:hypothetical protein NLI96_g5804 [Meripilus lineatus]|uniref:Cupin type-2 domain-containing protein n=1 Tax=Meripilus lineatus TaxID=2056292 RepID=A0AAD5V299_9APHY|nr:hypothetical protein NLI96_g5804 [Physisporinus lineatus]
MSSGYDTVDSPFPVPRRVITGHTPAGEATVILDEAPTPHFWAPGSRNAVHGFYQSTETPTLNDSELTSGWIDVIAENPGVAGLISRNGSTFRSIDYAPGSVSPFHRTHSLDYAIVVKGTIVLELDNDKRVTLHEGDTVVQRGTIHAWRNESDEWARVYFVVLDARPVSIGDRSLPEEWGKPSID